MMYNYSINSSSHPKNQNDVYPQLRTLAYFCLTQLLMFEAIAFIYKALLEIALDDENRRFGLPKYLGGIGGLNFAERNRTGDHTH
jgi:hypothetical protein